MKIKIFLSILLLIGAVYLFSCCNDNRTTYSNNDKIHADYNINYYVDTINGHVILSTVASSTNSNDISISTLELSN